MILLTCKWNCSLANIAASQPVSRGFVLLFVLIALLIAFFLIVLLMNASRRNRRKMEEARRLAERAASQSDRLDPWYEAGRRVNPNDDAS